MKTIKLLLIATAFALLAGSCGGGTPCPGFPAELADYFPYKVDDTLCFVNQHSDTTWVILQRVYTKQDRVYGSCTECDCDPPNKEFFASGKDYCFWGYITSAFENIVLTPYMEYVMDNNIHTSSFYSTISSTDTVPGVRVELKDSDAEITNRVIIVKGKGMVEFYDKGKDMLWQKIN